MRSEFGAGSVLTVAILGALAALATLSLPLYMGFATRQAVAGAADAAALAAADIVSGLVSGYPCAAAARVAAANGASLVSCAVDGFVVTVVASRGILGVMVTAAATAGPPGSGVD